MAEEVSLVRLYVMRGMYLLNCVLVGSGVFYQLVAREKPWDPMTGVAFSFWAALAALSALGIRYPVALLPVIHMQLLYKNLLVHRSLLSSAGGWPLKRPCPRFCGRNCIGHHRDSLDLCSCALHQAAQR
jgi:hypothetical protein